MKSHWFSVISVAGMLLMTGSVFGGGLQWKNPTVGVPITVSSIAPAPVGDAFFAEITLVQHAEPFVPALPSMPSTPIPSTLPQQTLPHQVTAPAEPWVPRSGTVLPALPRSAPVQTRTTLPCDDRIVFKSIRDISHDIRLTYTGEYPMECHLEHAPFHGRHFGHSCFMWTASGLSTRMAYFEDTQLERHGHTKVHPAFQPFLSGARFFGTIPILPYKMGVTPPNERVYTLGHIRSGSRAPYMKEPFPISLRGALWQAGAVVGAAYAAPTP